MDEQNEMEIDEPGFYGEEENEELSIVEKIIGVYVSPVSTFKYLAKRPDFWTALIVMSLISIALGMLILPKTAPASQELGIMVTEKLIEDQPISDAEKEEILAKTAEGGAGHINVIIGTPISLVITWIILTTLVYLISLPQGVNTDFKRLLGVLPWLAFVRVFSSVATTLVFINKGITDVTQVTNPALFNPLSLLALIPEGTELNPYLESFLSLIDPFIIWWAIIMVFAIEAANKCNRSQAITTAVITTIITIAAMTGFFGTIRYVIQSLLSS